LVTSLVTTVKAGKLTKVWVIFTDEALCEEFHSKCCGGTDKLPVSLSLKYFQLHNREHHNMTMEKFCCLS